MAAQDENIQLDSEFTYQQYSPPIIPQNISISGTSTGGAITTIDGDAGPGAVGPVLLLSGGATGFSFTAVGTSVTMTGSSSSSTLNEVTTAVDYPLTDVNDVVFVDTSGGAVTVTLHDPTTAKQKYYNIKLIVAGNTETIDGDGALIDGAATLTTSAQYTNYTLIPSNANGTWSIL